MATVRPLDIYCRTSGDESKSAPDQERDAREYAARKGVPLTGVVHVDRGKSGGNRNRPGLQKALDRVRRGDSGGLVVAYASRLTREDSGMSLYQEIIAAGGAVYGPNIPEDLTTADGRLQLNLQIVIDAHQRQKQGELTLKAKQRSIDAGIPVQVAPPGYRKGPDRRLEIDPATAPAIRRAFQMRLRGEGPTPIADMLNEAGVRTARGNRITIGTLRNILASRTYLGELHHGPDVEPNRNAHPPLIDADVWAAVQQVGVLKPEERSRPRRGDFYLLSGFIRCSSCGGPLVGTRDSTGVRIYRCTGRSTWAECTNRARVNADAVETRAVEALLSLRGDVAARGRNRGPTAAELATLAEEVATAERRLEQALRPEVQDDLGDAWGGVVRQRREAVEAAEAALGAARAADPAAAEFVTLTEAWRRGDKLRPEDRRRLLRAAFPHITVTRRGAGERLVELEPGFGFVLKTQWGRKPKAAAERKGVGSRDAVGLRPRRGEHDEQHSSG